MTPTQSDVWWALVPKINCDNRPPCIISRSKKDAQAERDSDERVIQVRVIEVKP